MTTPVDDSRRSSLGWGGALLIAAGAVYLIAEAVAAAGFRGYSYAANYISDLGISEPGVFDGRSIDSQHAVAMNTGFLLEGLLLLAGTVLISRRLSRGRRIVLLALAALHAVGGVLLAFFQSSESSIANGNIALHVLGAGAAIIAGNLLFLVGGLFALRPVLHGRVAAALCVLGAVGLVSLVMLRVADAADALILVPEGVWERAAVYAITVSEVTTGVALLRGRRRGQSA